MAPRIDPVAEPQPKYGYYDKLTVEQRRFIDEYLIDLNAAAAAVRAGYTNTGTGWHLLNRPEIQKAIAERRELVANDRGANGALWVLGKLWDVASADPSALSEIRRVPCRYCWGTNGQYQFTKTEMDRMYKAYALGESKLPFTALWPTGRAEQAYYVAGATKQPFDPQGGDGYTTRRDANPECSECAGLGVVLHYIGDTRKLGPRERQLYRGAKVGKDGKIEILMADQDEARNMLAKHYGIAVERREVYLRTVDPGTLSDDDLLRGIAELEAIDLERSEYRTVGLDPPAVGAGVPPETKRQRRQAGMRRAREAQHIHQSAQHRPLRRPRG